MEIQVTVLNYAQKYGNYRKPGLRDLKSRTLAIDGTTVFHINHSTGTLRKIKECRSEGEAEMFARAWLKIEST